MHKDIRKLVGILLLVVLLFSPLLAAQEQVPLSENLAVVLVIDVSASMADTDPSMLRETASNIFIDLLGPDDHLGIITFDTNAELVLPIEQVSTSQNKERIKEVLSGRLAPRGNTDYRAALELAYSQLIEADNKAAKKAVVFLTDGDPNPHTGSRNDAPFMSSYLESMWELTGEYTRSGYGIYSVGFGEDIDADVIRRISNSTNASYYLLNNSAEIAVSFFDVLGAIKNRMRFLDEAFTFGDTPRRIQFTTDEFTNQVNLVFIAEELSDIQVLAPRNVGIDDRLTIDRQQGYAIISLVAPGQDYAGDWEVVLTGTGQVEAFGDSDKYVQLWLEAPVGNSQHPLNEPIEFKVRVERKQQALELPLQVQVAVSKPETAGEQLVTLEQDADGYYKGFYMGADRVGMYQLEARALLGETIANTVGTSLDVRVIPALLTDFYVEDRYRIGESFVLTASLNMSGARVSEGSELSIDAFNLVMQFTDGETKTLPMYDSGSTEHGDSRASDGIWSNRILFDYEGQAEASYVVTGRFRGEPFVIEKAMGNFSVHPSGRVVINPLKRGFFTKAGGKITLPLEIHNDSAFRELIFPTFEGDFGSIGANQVLLEPGEIRTIPIEITMHPQLEQQAYTGEIHFRADHQLTAIEAADTNFEVDVLSTVQLLLLQLKQVFLSIGPIVLVILALVLVFLLGGMLFYAILVHPHTKVRGRVYYAEAGEEISGYTPNSIDLDKGRKSKYIISFDEESTNADYIIKGTGHDYDLEFAVQKDAKKWFFIQGWKALFKKEISAKPVVRSTQPGIMTVENEIFTQKDLKDEDIFSSGGIIFLYRKKDSRWFDDEKKGKNILEGRI